MSSQNFNQELNRNFFIKIHFFLTISFFVFALFGCDSGSNKKYLNQGEITDLPAFYQDHFIEVPGKEVFINDFSYKDIDGKTHTFSELRGKAVFLNFWATWCEPCRYEMADMEELFFDLKKSDFFMLALNVGEDKTTLINFLNKFPYSFYIGMDQNKKIAEEIGIKGLPTTLFISPKGKLLGTAVGPRKWTSKNFVFYFKQISKSNKN